jgi:hypothetical protein
MFFTTQLTCRHHTQIHQFLPKTTLCTCLQHFLPAHRSPLFHPESGDLSNMSAAKNVTAPAQPSQEVFLQAHNAVMAALDQILSMSISKPSALRRLMTKPKACDGLSMFPSKECETARRRTSSMYALRSELGISTREGRILNV